MRFCSLTYTGVLLVKRMCRKTEMEMDNSGETPHKKFRGNRAPTAKAHPQRCTSGFWETFLLKIVENKVKA